MAPLRRKGRRNVGGPGKIGIGKKLPSQGPTRRDLSSGSSRSGSSSGSGSSDEETSSCESNSDEDHPDDYKKGGYHPVMPYQLYNARYRVLSKLGAGAFSTVWLCADEKDSSSSLVAMKVCKSKKSVTEQAEDEIALLDRMQEGGIYSPHVVQMRGQFWHSGPNGRHKCMVFETMGENLLALVKYWDYKGVPVNIVRRLARHTLIGLEYIHSKGVIHTDIKLENVLIQRHDLADLVKEAHRAHTIFTEQKDGTEALSKSQRKRLKKKQKNSDQPEPEAKAEEPAEPPVLSKSQKKKQKQKQKQQAEAGADSDAEEPARYAAKCDTQEDDDGDDSDGDDAAAKACGRPVPPVRQKDRFKSLTAPQVFAKIADFGNGVSVDNKVTDDIQTRQYRSPEVIIGALWDETADLWSAACMFFELLTGDFLFDPRKSEDWCRDEDHLALMTELIGHCSAKEFLLSGKYSKDFYTNGGKLKHIKSLKFWNLQSVLHEKYKWSKDEAEEVCSFLQPMLEWRPKDRCSASKALQHFWVRAAPGELDVPDPEKFGTCSVEDTSTEAETPPQDRHADMESVADAKAPDAAPAAPKKQPPTKTESDASKKLLQETEEITKGVEDIKISEEKPAAKTAGYPEAKAAEAPAAPEPPERQEDAGKAQANPQEEVKEVSTSQEHDPEGDDPSMSSFTERRAVFSPPKQKEAQAANASGTSNGRQSSQLQKSSGQDLQQDAAAVAETAAPAAAETKEPSPPATASAPAPPAAAAPELVADTSATGKPGKGTSVEDFVDFGSLELSDCMPLVASLDPTKPEDCISLMKLARQSGCDCKRLDERYVIVIMKVSASAALARAAELARKANNVVQWISVEEYKATLPDLSDLEGGVENNNTKKKKNNKKNKKK